MAILETDESNIIDAEATNWKLIVLPVIAVLVVALGGTGFYFYQQHQRDVRESDARAQLVQAKTPEDFLKVASDFPDTEQATLATLQAGEASYNLHDYNGAIASYRKVADDDKADPVLRDSATLGVAASQDASGQTDQALASYQALARRRDNTPYAPFAFYSVAHYYELHGDKANQIQTLSEAAGLDANSMFTKRAEYELKQFSDTQKPTTSLLPQAEAPAPSPAQATP